MRDIIGTDSNAGKVNMFGTMFEAILKFFAKKPALPGDIRTSSRQLLNMLAFLAPDVRIGWFVSAPRFLPEPLKSEITNEAGRDNILAELAERSLVTVNDGKLRVERSIMDAVKDSLKREHVYAEYARHVLQFGKALMFLDFMTGESRTMFEELFPHKAAIVREIMPHMQNRDIALFCSSLGKGARDVLGDYDCALAWYEKARAVNERILGAEHPDVAAACSNIALVYSLKDDYDRALAWYEKARVVRETALGTEHPNTADTYNDIASVYFKKRDCNRALEWYGKACAIREKILGTEHRETAEIYSNIALVCFEKGEYAASAAYSKKSCAIREKILGTEHPEIATAYDNIAFACDRNGDYDDALAWFGKSRVLREKLSGMEHPDIAVIYRNIAAVYEHKGDYFSALEWDEKSRIVREKAFGKERSIQLSHTNN